MSLVRFDATLSSSPLSLPPFAASRFEFDPRLKAPRLSFFDPSAFADGPSLFFVSFETSGSVCPFFRKIRLQGLATLLAASSRRARAGYVSRRRRSWDSPFGAFSSRKVSGAFPPGRTHMPFAPPVSPTAEAVGRPGRPRLLGFCPSGSPWHDSGRLTRRRLDAPLGFALLGYASERLGRGVPRPPLTRLAARRRSNGPTCTTEYRSALT
jgi:hypothetical protein